MDNEKIVYTASEDTYNFFKENATVVYAGEIYYYMPYWFKDLGNGKFEQIRFENLPKDVIDLINKERNGLTIKDDSDSKASK